MPPKRNVDSSNGTTFAPELKKEISSGWRTVGFALKVVGVAALIAVFPLGLGALAAGSAAIGATGAAAATAATTAATLGTAAVGSALVGTTAIQKGYELDPANNRQKALEQAMEDHGARPVNRSAIESRDFDFSRAR